MPFQTGDALQFDWSEEHVVLGGIALKVKVAHFRLCHSRKPFVVAYPGEPQEMVLDAFVRALAFYGGVPRRVIIDTVVQLRRNTATQPDKQGWRESEITPENVQKVGSGLGETPRPLIKFKNNFGPARSTRGSTRLPQRRMPT